MHDADPTSPFQIIVINDPNASYNSTVKRKLKIVVGNVNVYLGQKIGSHFAITVNSVPVTLPFEGNPRIREVSKVCLSILLSIFEFLYWFVCICMFFCVCECVYV